MAGYIDFGQPNCTLYVQNLNEHIAPKHLVPELKSIFSEHGPVIEVIAKRRLALRGQAFVIFQSQESARKALECLQGERIYGKSMVIRYARYKSDVISKTDGTYEIEKRRREQDRIERAQYPRMTRRQLMAQMGASPGMMPPPGMMMQPPGMMMQPHGMMMQSPGMMMPPGMMMMSPGAAHPGMMPMMGNVGAEPQMVGGELQLPNRVLYLQNIPEGVGEGQLSDLFKRHAGFVEIRMVPNRPGLAFAEYESDAQATTARQALDGHELSPGCPLRVAFAKR